MSVIVAPIPAPTVPGVEVSSTDGSLTAVVHAGFPGVLLRVESVGATPIWRTDGSDWTLVRGAAPMVPSSGLGFAYDAETAPDRTYLYARAQNDPDSYVSIRQPGWASDDWSAWLISAEDPSVSRLVNVEHLPAQIARRSRSAVTDVIGARLGAGRRGVRTGASWSMTLMAFDDAERAAIERLLDTGPLLYHPHPLCQAPLAGAWLMPGDYPVESYGANEWAHLMTVVVDEVARPATTLTDPLRIPGWTWTTSTSGLADYAAYASAYPTTWDQLKAGIGGWSQ